jgi:hypothetical protein
VYLPRFRGLNRSGTNPGALLWTCQSARLAVVSDLPIKRLTRATPIGQSALAVSKDVSPHCLFLYHLTGGGNSHREGHYQRKAPTAPNRYRAPDRTPLGFLCRGRQGGNGGHSSGDCGRLREADLYRWSFSAVCLMSSSHQTAGWQVCRKQGTAGRQTEFSRQHQGS